MRYAFAENLLTQMELDKILVLYATQTGTAEDVAERIGREAKRRHYKPIVLSMDRYDPAQLSNEVNVIFVVSTTGQGDLPDSMKSFWKFVLRKSLGNKWLNKTHYSVFGLGDSGYQKYNVVAKKLDRRLFELGAQLLIPKGLGDDQHRSGYEASLDPWLASLCSTLQERIPLPSGYSDYPMGSELDPPKFKIVYHEAPAILSCDHISEAQREWAEHERARVLVERASGVPMQMASDNNGSFGHTPFQPVIAQVIKNVRLTGMGYEQDVRHIEFDLGDSGVEYGPGDVLGVFPRQERQAVDAFLERCKLDPAAYITVAARDSSFKQETPVKVRDLVEAVMDVNSATPRRYFFEVMSHFASAEHEKEKLQYFSTSAGREELYQYNNRERRTVLEVLEDFPSVELPLEWLVQLVPRLRPRFFSISSSLRAHPNEVHITVAVVQWTTPFKRMRQGLCSTWLSQLDSKLSVVPIWLKEGLLKMPPPSVPLILVGPGTGCAPFHAFIEERAALSSIQNVAPVMLFFGCRYQEKDFLYKDFWTACSQGRGIISEEKGGGFFVAFSRDQPHKVYVQHKIRETSKKVWNLIQSGAAIFVAGSANKLPADVSSAFEDVIISETHSKELAEKLLKQLERLGRYTVEVWS